jgi:hypothetical protein
MRSLSLPLSLFSDLFIPACLLAYLFLSNSCFLLYLGSDSALRATCFREMPVATRKVTRRKPALEQAHLPAINPFNPLVPFTLFPKVIRPSFRTITYSQRSQSRWKQQVWTSPCNGPLPPRAIAPIAFKPSTSASFLAPRTINQNRALLHPLSSP